MGIKLNLTWYFRKPMDNKQKNSPELLGEFFIYNPFSGIVKEGKQIQGKYK